MEIINQYQWWIIGGILVIGWYFAIFNPFGMFLVDASLLLIATPLLVVCTWIWGILPALIITALSVIGVFVFGYGAIISREMMAEWSTKKEVKTILKEIEEGYSSYSGGPACRTLSDIYFDDIMKTIGNEEETKRKKELYRRLSYYRPYAEFKRFVEETAPTPAPAKSGEYIKAEAPPLRDGPAPEEYNIIDGEVNRPAVGHKQQRKALTTNKAKRTFPKFH